MLDEPHLSNPWSLSPGLSSAADIIEEARNGRMFVLIDDVDEQSVGDLVLPAQMATPEAINFMATHGRGLVCLALTAAHCRKLGLEPMRRSSGAREQGAFAVSIEAREGITTGISAHDRTRTIGAAINASCTPDDIVKPGHVFPLIAREGGVLASPARTEAAVDVARLAGLNPSGVLCEILNETGARARWSDLLSFAHHHDLRIGTIRSLVAYRHRHDPLVHRVESVPFDSPYGGSWLLHTYRSQVDGADNFILQKGTIKPGQPTLVRLHRASLLEDLMVNSSAGGQRLHCAMDMIADAGAGVIVMLVPRDRSGTSLHATHPPLADHDHARQTNGFAVQALADLGVRDMVLLADDAAPMPAGLEGDGLAIVGQRILSTTTSAV